VDKREQMLALVANGGTERQQIVLSEDYISLFISDLLPQVSSEVIKCTDN